MLEYDPFQRLDEVGVGKLMKIGVELGRKARPNLKMGICGEHGGEPNSVKFCHKLGLDYVSCSPYRVTVARLAAAQAAIEEKRGKKELIKKADNPGPSPPLGRGGKPIESAASHMLRPLRDLSIEGAAGRGA